LEAEVRLAQEAVAQLIEAKDKAEEKAKKIIEELQRKSLTPRRLPFLFIGDEKLRVIIAAALCAEYRHHLQA
jgi:ABC-type arginine transport system ATPase subunit